YFSISSIRVVPVLGVRPPVYPTAKILRDFVGMFPGELSLNVGDDVNIVGWEGDWCDGEIRNESGWFPSNILACPPGRSRINNSNGESVVKKMDSSN
ncbi:hypothetical protein PENTCL1PPCAC_2108, partial [Pristionchus entomophagus]